MRNFCYTLMTLILFNCSKPENGITDPIIGFNSSQVVNDLSYNETLALIGTDKLLRGVEKPNPDGSLGRNKQGYFHVYSALKYQYRNLRLQNKVSE